METPEPDYPAAHSMDTGWYAVDADGHVALFDTGEAGAVPEGAYTEESIDRSALAGLLPETSYHLLDWVGDDGREHHVDLPSRDSKASLGKTLMFLGSIDLAQAEIDGHQAEQAPASEGVAVLFHGLAPELAWRLHEAGACLGCFAWPEEERGWSLYSDLPRRLGLFSYDHEDRAENWISGGYIRNGPPARPIRLEDFPAVYREAVGRIRFDDLRFADARRIDPIPRFPCSSWEAAYLDPDGVTIRPIPGREADFDPDAYPTGWANNPRFRVELPDRPPSPGPESHPTAE